MVGPFSSEEIARARRLPLFAALNFIGAFHKADGDYVSSEPACKSKRIHVNYQGRDFRFIVTGEKWVNELLPRGSRNRGGGGAIDFVSHITGLNFVQAVRICLQSSERGVEQWD